MIGALLTGIVLWCGWELWRLSRLNAAIIGIKKEIQAGATATRYEIFRLCSPGNPGPSSALSARSLRESEGKHPGGSRRLDAYSDHLSFAARALHGRMEVLVDRGRISDAEQLLSKAAADPRIDASSLHLLLGLTCSIQGRIDEGERIIEACWKRLDQAGEGASEQAILLVCLYMQLLSTQPPADVVRGVLEKSAGPPPTTIASGSPRRFWRLARVHWTRPVDGSTPASVAGRLISMSRARLAWALATSRVADVRLAAGRIPANSGVDAAPRRRIEEAWVGGGTGRHCQ